MLRKGRFYEGEELRDVAKILPEGAGVLDVGANLGNHALFFATQAGAAQVLVIEPNPLALAPLLANVVMNELRGVIRTEALGIGLGARAESGFSIRRRVQNLGRSRMERGGGDALELHPGDALFADEWFDLVKIDVEGIEMEVLEGMEKTIARCRPVIFIEVDNVNADAFGAWCGARDYGVHSKARRYPANLNCIVQPVETMGEAI
nr:FkbM family methyltransferase [Sagittula salina]